MKFAVALLALVAVAVNAAAVKKVTNLKAFSYTSCSAAPEAIVINSFTITPDPIVIPGTVTFSLSLTGSVAVVSPTPGDMTISYRPDATTDYVVLPCVDGYGSCHTDDACLYLEDLFPIDQPCPQAFIDANVPCHCPFEATTYTVTDASITFTEPLSTLQPGDYILRIVLDSTDGVELQCYDFSATIVAG